ncbi:MAG TPA: hypothetical protein VFX30_02915 [bacterium]|nr:hypothetical protein [bacterium]
MMPQVLRVVGGLRLVLALVGLSLMLKSVAGDGVPVPFPTAVTQVVLIVTTVVGGIGWLLLRDWGRKVLLVSSLFTVFQAVSVVFMNLLPSGAILWPLLLGVLVALVTLVLIFLPAARCEKPSWNAETNANVFRAVGVLQILAAAALAVLLVSISASAEGMALALLTAPTAVVALLGGLGMFFLKNAGRRTLIVLWTAHAVFSGLGPVFSSLPSGDLWQILLTGALTRAVGSVLPALSVSNFVYLGTSLLLVLAWLPTPEEKKN